MVSLQRPRLLNVAKGVEQALAPRLRQYLLDAQGLALLKSLAVSIMVALALVAATTLCVGLARLLIGLEHVSSAYLIPVLIAAIRLGMIPAVLAAIGGVAVSAFFFYPPIYDFRISDPDQLLDLTLFIVVAAVTSQLAARERLHAVLAQERENEMRALYVFSKRLAVATDPAQIYSAIQAHVSTITGCRVVYFEAGATQSTVPQEAGAVPDAVLRAVHAFGQERGGHVAVSVDDEQSATRWLIRPVSPSHPAFGLVAIDVGRVAEHGQSPVQHRVDEVLADASATLERLDVAHAIGEVKLRAEAETLRAALIGSVSHGLRTPLASIIGSASILAQAPAVTEEPRLAALAGIVRDEAERLNSEIQRLLDASRINSAGVRPQVTWADPTDIVNAAVARQCRSMDSRQVAIRLAEDLPLVRVDPVLIERALEQILDNAAKYSPDRSEITIEAHEREGEVIIVVGDEGAGLTEDERGQIFERFYRGSRTLDATPGSGLGLWIARAFVVACGGRLDVASKGPGQGTIVSLTLPQTVTVSESAGGDTDD